MMNIKQRSKTLSIAALTAAILSLSACATVSEETCEAGNWEAVGFKDGANGKSADRLADIAKACTKHGASVDNQSYLEGYEKGLPKYCTYERGFERGESGSKFNAVCSGDLAEEYGPGYEEGRQQYAINQKYAELVQRYEYKTERLYEYRQRLQSPNLSDRDRDRLRREIRRLEREVDNLRYNIKEFRRRYNVRRDPRSSRSIGY